MTTDRDTHFQGFAKLLWDDIEREIRATYEFIPEGKRMRHDFLPIVHTLIAKRAYDLIAHTIDSLWPYINDKAVEPSPADIPDLDEWPTTVD